MIPYDDVFCKIESTLRSQSKLSNEEFDIQFGRYKEYANRDLSDDEYFEILTNVPFYSGFKAETVTNKLDVIKYHFPDFESVSNYDDERINEIFNDAKMIKNKPKILACINNSKVFKNIVKEYGSFRGYVDSFEVNDSFENLMLFKEEIEYRFDYLGKITSYHFMTDIGLPVLKPDRVIARIFKRLNLIEDEKQLLKTVIHGRKFSHETGFPIRYVDIILVKYGQVGKDDYFGLEDGICLKNNPKCNICGIKEYCSYQPNHVSRQLS